MFEVCILIDVVFDIDRRKTAARVDGVRAEKEGAWFMNTRIRIGKCVPLLN